MGVDRGVCGGTLCVPLDTEDVGTDSMGSPTILKPPLTWGGVALRFLPLPAELNILLCLLVRPWGLFKIIPATLSPAPGSTFYDDQGFRLSVRNSGSQWTRIPFM